MHSITWRIRRQRLAISILLLRVALIPNPFGYDTNMRLTLTVVFQAVPEGYIGFVEELPGANTQGRTLEEARANLQEAIDLVLDTNRMLAEESLAGQSVIREPLLISS